MKRITKWERVVRCLSKHYCLSFREDGSNNRKHDKKVSTCPLVLCYLPLRMNSSEQRIKSNTRTVPSTEEVASLASVGEKLMEKNVLIK